MYIYIWFFFTAPSPHPIPELLKAFVPVGLESPSLPLISAEQFDSLIDCQKHSFQLTSPLLSLHKFNELLYSFSYFDCSSIYVAVTISLPQLATHSNNKKGHKRSSCCVLWLSPMSERNKPHAYWTWTSAIGRMGDKIRNFGAAFKVTSTKVTWPVRGLPAYSSYLDFCSLMTPLHERKCYVCGRFAQNYLINKRISITRINCQKWCLKLFLSIKLPFNNWNQK